METLRKQPLLTFCLFFVISSFVFYYLDAVTRIIKVKKDSGVFDDPLFENLKNEQNETGSLEYRKVAEQLVEESLVLKKVLELFYQFVKKKGL